MSKRRSNDLFRMATAPARFALDQTRTNLRAVRRLREDLRDYRAVLAQATAETSENLARVLSAAEMSLPADIQAMSPAQRQRAIEEALARGQAHLFAAAGELYRAVRLAEPGLAPPGPAARGDRGTASAGQARPGQARSGQARPGRARPGRAQPGQTYDNPPQSTFGGNRQNNL